jgi:membrane carboxypeptidase/penicillin-binding protein PbpC
VVDPPTGLAETSICALSGMRAGDACPIKRRERLAAGAGVLTGPACTWHHAGPDGVVTVWPARYRAWAQSAGLLTPRERVAARQVAAARKVEAQQASATGLRVTSPAAGTVFLIDPTLRPEFQAVPLRAMGAGDGQVSWTVNGRTVGSSSADASVDWPLERGRQHAVVRDATGRTAEVSFTVK